MVLMMKPVEWNYEATTLLKLNALTTLFPYG